MALGRLRYLVIGKSDVVMMNVRNFEARVLPAGGGLGVSGEE